MGMCLSSGTRIYPIRDDFSDVRVNQTPMRHTTVKQITVSKFRTLPSDG